MGGRNPRRSHARDVLWCRVRSFGRPCHVCGLPIDPSLPAGHPLCFELDELVPVARGGSPRDASNVAGAHRCCNQWKSDRMPAEVARVRAEAQRRFGAWRTPLDFVAKARAVCSGGRPGPARTPGGLPTSREW